MTNAFPSEQDWIACNEPAELLRQFDASRLTPRKLRLFACACCQRVWSYLNRAAVFSALHVAERFADGQASVEELRAGWIAVRRALSSTPLHTKWEDALMAALHMTTEAMSVFAVTLAAEAAARALDADWRQRHPPSLNPDDQVRRRRGSQEERLYQSRILRDIFPFRPPEHNRVWGQWQNGIVVTLAQAIYEEERFQDLPILGDALEDAGCTDQALLKHCREQGVHVRGCWLVDLLTGRN